MIYNHRPKMLHILNQYDTVLLLSMSLYNGFKTLQVRSSCLVVGQKPKLLVGLQYVVSTFSKRKTWRTPIKILLVAVAQALTAFSKGVQMRRTGPHVRKKGFFQRSKVVTKKKSFCNQKSCSQKTKKIYYKGLNVFYVILFYGITAIIILPT